MQAPSSCIVFTPKAVADAMVSALRPRADERFLEPCVGGGSLVQALARRGIPREAIRGLDLDRHPRPSDGYARVIRDVDFLDWSVRTAERFDKIIANPPFLALSRLPTSLRKNALQVVDPFSQRPVTLGGNYWQAFLCAAISLLAPDGSLCFLLPAAWDYTNYARALREELPTHFEHVCVHRSCSPLFDRVREGSVVLVARGFHRANRTFRRIEHNTVQQLLGSLANEKQLESSSAAAEPGLQPKTRHTKLGELVKIRIGAVTGDSGYFLLTEQERRNRNIPVRCCVKVLTRSSHLSAAAITLRLWNRLRDEGERVWMFWPEGKGLNHKSVRRYLRLKPEKSGCHRQRFKVQCRSPWYRTILPADVDGFLSGMSSLGPWIALSRVRKLSATNTLYVVTFKKAKTSAERAAIGLSLLTTSARDALSSVGRRYADGLLKYEPGDLGKVEIPVIAKFKGVTRRYRQAIEKLLDGEVSEAQRLADESFFDSKPEVTSRKGSMPTGIRPSSEADPALGGRRLANTS
jgi:adenine-specific DNA-methyltransferase